MWGGKKDRETTIDRLFFVTRIINVFREAKLKIMTKRTYFMSFCYSLISDDFVMEVIAKSGKNAIIESDYIGFVCDRKHQKRYLLPRRNRINSHRENEKFN